MSNTPETFEQTIGKLLRSWWHEDSCPAHSSNMSPEDECDCLLSTVMENMDKVIAAHNTALEAAKREARIDELSNVQLEHGYYATQTFVSGRAMTVLERIAQLSREA